VSLPELVPEPEPSYAAWLRNLVVSRIRRRLQAAGGGVHPPDWLVEEYAEPLPRRRPPPAAEPLGRLSPEAATVAVATGLIELDIRFGALFAALQDPLHSRRPCVGLLSWLLATDEQPPAAVTACCHELVAAGVLATDNQSDPRAEWVLRVPVPVWDLLCHGDLRGAVLPDALVVRSRSEFPALAEVILPEAAAGFASRLPLLLAEPTLSALVLRGSNGTGRATLLGSAAAAVGRDAVIHDGHPDPATWQLYGALCWLSDALPIVRCRTSVGETTTLPDLRSRPAGPIGIVAGRSGGLDGGCLKRAMTVSIGSCGADDRRSLWRAAGLDATNSDLEPIVEQFLLTPGNIQRAAPLAVVTAQTAGRTRITTGDVQSATRTLQRESLETLATHLDPIPATATPVLGSTTDSELEVLRLRCRHRERLLAETSATCAGLNRGVRALFTGPSGTGKTLAARHLAARLSLDLYRVDLAAVVNKYIGETERNLDQVLSRAEELDVVLLLDEGDALMARRTDVSNANDRYANLETNFLLQRLETYDGIVVVTTNAGNRIDDAFLRRIDVIVDFVPPDAEQRWLIWAGHLPADHEVRDDVLVDVARRCELTGGQIRNTALHATLLGIESGAPVSSLDLLSAVRREYRRVGAACPIAEPGADIAPSAWDEWG
jgi:hypothetical protein